MFRISAGIILAIFCIQLCVFEGVKIKCPKGWLQYANNCYLLGGNKEDWFKAKAQCDNVDAHLATIESGKENEWIYQQLLALGGNDSFWIGANQLKRQKEWRWVSNGQLAIFHDVPLINDVTGSHCIALWQHYKFSWVDHPCSVALRFICKRNMDA